MFKSDTRKQSTWEMNSMNQRVFSGILVKRRLDQSSSAEMQPGIFWALVQPDKLKFLSEWAGRAELDCSQLTPAFCIYYNNQAWLQVAELFRVNIL